MGQTFVNIHGRKPNRGIRPWLLIPKVIAVGIYLGGLVTLAALCHVAGSRAAVSAPSDGPPTSAIRWVVSHIVDPAGLAATLLGILLFLQHPREFARQRWWQVKFGSLLILIPAAKWLLAMRLSQLENATGDGQAAAMRITEHLLWALAGGVVWIVVLGRLKPRLGQKWVRTRGSPNDATDAPPDPEKST